MRFSFAVLAVALSFAGGAFARADVALPEAAWRTSRTARDLRIQYQDSDVAHARAYRAIGEIDAPPDAVYRVVTDVERHPTFMPYITESTIIRRISPRETIVYQVISPPVVGSRDAYFRITTTPGTAPTDVWRSAWVAVPEFAPERPGYVRLRIAEGSWVFEPLDGGTRSRVTYTALTNVGGSIPGWLANTSSESAIVKIYAAVRKRVHDAGH